MLSTPPTLLARLRRENDPRAWDRFIDLYSPLLFEWARRNGVPVDDAADLVQNVLVLLIRQMPLFEKRPGGSFRGWLFTVMQNRGSRRTISPDPIPSLHSPKRNTATT